MRKVLIVMLIMAFCGMVTGQETDKSTKLDERVRSFLKSHKNEWRDMNISESDGQALYDLIIENKYTRAVEIGTSTGRSAIWIAWALSKTGGKLITIEINERRYNKALENFREAGLTDYIDARLADAHELVPRLKGPFDFVFMDADKGWYKHYFESLAPKMEQGGAITAHNVMNRYISGIREFIDYINGLDSFETEILRSSSSGISVSIKK